MPPKTSLDWAFIMNGLEVLEVMGSSFRSSNSALFMCNLVTKIREYFFFSNLIEAVISFPSFLFSPYTHIPTAFFFFYKNKISFIYKFSMFNATIVPVI